MPSPIFLNKDLEDILRLIESKGYRLISFTATHTDRIHLSFNLKHGDKVWQESKQETK